MKRPASIAAMAVGSVALFALFAIVGWLAVDSLTSSDEEVGEAPIAMIEYPVSPVKESASAASNEEQTSESSETSEEVVVEIPPIEGPEGTTLPGDLVPMGNSVRVVSSEMLEPGLSLDAEGSDAGGAEAASTADAARDDGDVDADTEDSGAAVDEADDPIPAVVLTDAPFLFGHLDLDDVVVADPVGPLQFDVCAGSDFLPPTETFCPPGFGGTIVPFDGDPPESTDVADTGRPPTGLTAFGSDTLYVRVFARADEFARVEFAKLEDDSVSHVDECDPDRDVTSRTSVRQHSVIPIDTSGASGDWPYDPSIDTLGLFKIALEEGSEYAICVYWDDSTGVETVTSYWEAFDVQTPSVRSFSVLLFTRERPLIAPIREIREAAVSVRAAGCTVEYIPHGPLPESTDTPVWGEQWGLNYEPPKELCRATHVSDVLQNGGFPVEFALIPALDGSVVRGSSWVSIDRSDIMCRTSCTDGFAVRVPMPSVAFEPVDLGGPFATGSQVASAGSILLSVFFEDEESDARTDWVLGDAVEFDTSDRVVAPPPLLTSIGEATPTDLEMARLAPSDASASGEAYATTRWVRITNDEPVRFELELVGGPSDAGVEPCVPSGDAPQSYRSDDYETSVVVHLDDLCLGEKYHLQVLATDVDGMQYDVRRVSGRPDLANLYSFSTGSSFIGLDQAYTVDIDATLELESPPVSESPFGWVYRIGDFRVGQDSSVATGPILTDIDESSGGWDDSGWWQLESEPSALCRQPRTSDLPPPDLMFSLEAVAVSESSNSVVQQVDLRLQDFTIPGGSLNCHTRLILSGGGSTESTRLVTSVTLTELKDGVTITYGEDEFPRITLRLAGVISFDGRPGAE